ncbi:MAG: putative peptidoglycan glycosyltransferase FtsW [Pseudomonadota bacterium]
MTSLSGSAPLRSDRSLLSEWRRTVDWPILAAAFILIGLGLLLSLAAGPAAAMREGFSDPAFFTRRHALFAAAGAVTLIGSSLLDRDWARRFAALVFFGAFALMAFILVFGHEAKGAQRWLRIAGFSLQPSEFIKPALILLTGWLLAQRNLFPDGPWAPVAFAFFIATLGLLLLQPDVGQSALLGMAFVITFFVAGTPWRWIASFCGGGIALITALYATLPHVRLRVNAFFNPTAYDTYQIDKASEAIARGGLMGAGPGEGAVKMRLPDAHTDFIFSVLSEEYGLVAALALIGVLAFITLRGLHLAADIEDSYPRAAAVGLFSLFGLQAAINIAVNVSLIPPKGMTLPFVSYGGSSMLGIALTLGLALALIRRPGAYRRGYLRHG